MNGEATFPERVLRWFVPRLSPETRPWGEAMLAELEAVRGRAERLLWVMGGATVMMRMLLRQWLRPGAAWATGADPLAGGSRPPRRWVGIAMVALALGLLLAPSFRQSIRVAYATWRLASSSYTVPSSYSEMNEVARRGEQQHDAVLLAFAALRTLDPAKRAQWAAKAIALDPSLLWIRMPLAYADMWDSISHEAGAHSISPRIGHPVAPPFAELQAQDPGNGFVYLLESNWIVFQAGKGQMAAKLPPEQIAEIEANPRWRAAVEQAYHGPRWDDYSGRAFSLTREAMRRLHWSNPVVLATAVRPSTQPWFTVGVMFRARRGSGLERHVFSITYSGVHRWNPTWWQEGPPSNTQNASYLDLALVVMISSAVAALCAFLLLLAWIVEGSLRRPQPRTRLAARWVQGIAAPLLLGSCTLMYLCYRPFAGVYEQYAQGGGGAAYGSMLIAFASFSAALNRMAFVGGENRLYFWSIGSIVLTLVLLWRVRRMIRALSAP